MNKIYTYISSTKTLTTIIRAVTTFLRGHKKAMLLLVCFVFLGMSAPANAQVTLSGTIYSDAGSTPDGTVRTINVAVGTSTPGVFASTSMTTSGAYTVTIPAGSGIAIGTPIMVWIDGGTVFGSVVTKASSSIDGANITGLDIYRNRLITRHEGTSATSTTINDLSFYTIGQDADVTHATTSNGEIVVRSGVELYVWGGDTFAPGGAITVAGNAGAGATEGSMTMGASSVYTAGGNLRLAGSLSVPSSATFNAGSSTIFFVASTTGKTISAPVSSIGNVTFAGNGGGWTFTSSATTSSLAILVGSVTAPSTALAVQGTYQNYGTFNNNGGKMTIIGAPTIPAGDFPSYTAGLDTSGSAAGTGNLQINHLAVSSNGRTLYAGKAGNATACSQTAGLAIGCELMIFDIANTAAPEFVGGRDVSGDTTGIGNSAINYLLVVGNYLYVANAGSVTACSQTAGSAIGCELMVYDISSTTNPTYVAGRDMDGTATGVVTISAMSLAAKGTSLYVAKAAAGTTNCSTTASNCELMVFDISSTTNPTYQTGLDTSGSPTGVFNLTINSLSVIGDLLIVGKAGNGAACSQTAGSATGCELMIFDIASTTNPNYLAGRDVSGSAAGTGNLAITFVTGTGTTAYVAKAANATACSQTAGSALGCEIMAFDITSSTSPTYARGVDMAGSQTGQQAIQVFSLHAAGNYLYAANNSSAPLCKQNIGLATGCELTVFDISSSTAVVHITGRDVSGTSNGVQAAAHTAMVSVGNMLFVARSGAATACSQTAGTTGAASCELAAFSLTNQPKGILMGNLTGSNALGNVVATGTVEFRDSATTSNLTVSVGTTTLPALITVTGDFQNNANLVSLETALKLDSSSAQSIGGNLVGTNELYTLQLSGSGSKTFSSNASTTFLTIDSGASATFPNLLTVSDTYTNNGTVNAGSGTLNTNGYAGGFLAGVSAGGSLTDVGSTNFNSLVRVGSTVFAAKSNSNTACSQTAGSAVGCELMVFNIESPTAPSYRAGRDAQGNTVGTGNISMNHLAVSGNNQTLYVAKGGDATACTQSSSTASGCELMVFDISSTTNPVFVGGRDVNGNTVGTGNLTINFLFVSGNYLYVAKAGNATACTQSSSTASGCELMVFDISSTTYPEFVAGRDMDGTATGVQNIAAASLAATGTSLYVAKAASGATACSTTALNCELMVFDISSTTNPTYQTGRDTSGSAAGVQSLAINTLNTIGNVLIAGKSANATACSQTAGSAVGCELLFFDVSSTTNPTYISGRDVSGSAAGTGNLAITYVTSTGTTAYVAKAANVTNCSQEPGSAIGCELMAFDVSSTTNPLFVRGLDASLETNGDLSLGIQTVLAATSSLLVGKVASALPCEQSWNLRTGCELLQLKMPTTLNGTMTGTSRLNNLTTLGLTEITTNASTSNLTIASSSVFTAPSTTLSFGGNFLRGGEFRANRGTVALTGREQSLIAPATTTFYNLYQVATTSATTTFSTNGVWQVEGGLTLSGTSSASKLKVQSTASGTQWTILPQGSVTVSHLIVKDSNNSSTTQITCGNGCFDATNNSNWSFTAPTTTANYSVSFQDGIDGYDGTTDTYIQTTSPTTSYGSTDPIVIDGDPQTVALLKWDISSIPADATVTGASVILNVTNESDGSYELYQALRPWTNSATWNTYDGSASWGTAGAQSAGVDLATTSYGAVNLGSGNTGTATIVLDAAGVALVQGWVSGTITNNGFGIYDMAVTNGVQYNSSEALTATARPKLTVDYTAIVEPPAHIETWNTTDWLLYDTVTINESQVDADLTDFPVYIDMSSLSSTFWSMTPDSVPGTDIRVTTADNVEVPREIVWASTVDNSGELHFKAPSISSTTNTVFKIWYNGTTTGDYSNNATYGAENVWSSNYLGVYHLNAGATAVDSTAFGRDGFGGSGSFTPSVVQGKVGRALDFDGDDFITVTGLFGQPSSIYISTWSEVDAVEDIGSELVSLGDNVMLRSGTSLRGYHYDTFGWEDTLASSSVSLPYNWLHVAYAVEPGLASERIYVNGQPTASSTFSNPILYGSGGANTWFGHHGNGGASHDLDGRLDEIRIASTSRSNPWIKAEYANQSNFASFITMGLIATSGSSTLSVHSAGQVSNAFSAKDQTNEPLYAFRLAPTSGVATVNHVTFSLSQVLNLDNNTFSNIRLIRDNDSDREFDVTDEVVGSGGAMAIDDRVGTITFFGDFSATTTQNYLLVADFVAPSNGTFLTIELLTSDIVMTAGSGIEVIYGTVGSVRHFRNNKGGGGGNVLIGDAAPAGAGSVGGGGSGSGETIGNDPDYAWPSNQSGAWTGGASAYDQVDGTYATTNGVANHQYANHSFVVPGSNTVQGIIIKLELSGTTGAGTVDVQLSWDGGTSWTATKSTPTLGTGDVVYTLGSPSDLWGRSWSANDFSNANFAVRVIGNPSSNTVRLDAIQARVYHIAGGGGGGGGGEI